MTWDLGAMSCFVFDHLQREKTTLTRPQWGGLLKIKQATKRSLQSYLLRNNENNLKHSHPVPEHSHETQC